MSTCWSCTVGQFTIDWKSFKLSPESLDGNKQEMIWDNEQNFAVQQENFDLEQSLYVWSIWKGLPEKQNAEPFCRIEFVAIEAVLEHSILFQWDLMARQTPTLV